MLRDLYSGRVQGTNRNVVEVQLRDFTLQMRLEGAKLCGCTRNEAHQTHGMHMEGKLGRACCLTFQGMEGGGAEGATIPIPFAIFESALEWSRIDIVRRKLVDIPGFFYKKKK